LPEEPKGTIVDFGCGAGYFSIEFARTVGEEGHVIAIDVLPSAIEALESQIKLFGIKNVTTKRANLEREGGSGLSPNSADWVIAKDVLFQNADKGVILREIHRILRPGGHAIIMEWGEVSGLNVGPEAGSRIGSEELKRLLGDAGFSGMRDLPVGTFHYAFLVSKQ
jgi:ubiquinone/menaquinone biosynthesis C-methylase UbiE